MVLTDQQAYFIRACVHFLGAAEIIIPELFMRLRFDYEISYVIVQVCYGFVGLSRR